MQNQNSDIYEKLLKFSETMLTLEKPISDTRIEDFENNIKYKLPTDYKYFLKKHNGFSLNGTEVYGLGNEYGESSLSKIYDFEHYQVGNPMPTYFLPFSPDNFGNHYCIDLSTNNDDTCPIIFWQHDFDYENFTQVETCNLNFTDWVNEVLIEWTLENNNYDGTEK